MCLSFSCRAVLGPLLDLPPPAQTLMLVVDSLDVRYGVGEGDEKSGSIAELLATNQHLLPGWLLLVCSVRRQNKAVCKMFSGITKEKLISMFLKEIFCTFVELDMCDGCQSLKFIFQ